MTSASGASHAAILYSRPGCPLCFSLLRTARRAARRHGVPLRVVDIRSDAELLARYDTEVPVLALPGGGTIQGAATPEDVEAAFEKAARTADGVRAAGIPVDRRV